MAEVGAFAAKTHFSSLLDRVEKGETITITRHGRPAALLAPVAPRRRLSADELVAAFRELRQRVKPGPPSIREMIEQGRRY